MQPNQGFGPGPQMSLPSSTSLPYESFLESWWVTIPAALRRYSVYLSETWADGVYLTAWPMVALVAPLAALLFSLLEGITHWNLLINDTVLGSGSAVTFTELLPLMVLIALAGAISANFGLVMVLGYAIGDFLIAGFRFSYPGLEFQPSPNPLQSFVLLRLAQLISYILLLLLAVTPTLSAKYLVPRLDTILRTTEPTSTLLRVGMLAVIQGAIVYSWTLAAPLLIRIFWAWTDGQPPLSAAYYLQELGGWVVVAAVVGAAGHGWLAYLAQRNQSAVQRIERQASALRAADTHLAFTRQLPAFVRAILAAAVLTLLISGFIVSASPGSLVEALLMFIFLAFILIARMALLPSLGFWKSWVALIFRLPLLARLAIGAFASYILSQPIIAFYQNQQLTFTSTSESFLPIVISIGLSLLIMTALIPPVSSVPSSIRPSSPVQPTAAMPPPYMPPPYMPPTQQPQFVPPPPAWSGPPSQPPQQPPPNQPMP
jgi:hypothetical protein